MTLEELLRLSPPELAAALAPLTEKERKVLAPAVRALHIGPDLDAPAHPWLLAAGCLGSARQVARAVQFAYLRKADVPLVVRVLRDRRPAWLPALAAAFADDVRVAGWRVIRGLVRDGVLEPPDSEWYVTATVYSIAPGWARLESSTPLAELREDPELLDEHVWAVLRTEGAGSRLAAQDSLADGTLTKYRAGEPAPELTWRHALVTLAAEGALDRDRLLDAALAAFLRDWRVSELPWFATLHAALAPSDDELAARQGTYVRLLAVPYGPAVELAQQAFARLLKAGRLDTDALLAATPAVLQRREKARALAQLRLLGDLRKARPDLAAAVAEAARPATEHEKADVRERAAALVPDAAAPATVVAVPDEPPPARPAPAEVVPVTDADELAELFARLIEEADDPVEVERAYEGVARLARARPRHGADALVSRARDRVAELASPFARYAWRPEEPRANLAQLVLTWLAGARPGDPYPGRGRWVGYAWQHDVEDRSLGALVTHRAYEVAAAVHGGGARLLSLPATSDGALPAALLTERLRAAGRLGAPLPYDVAVAALRVPPAEHADVTAPGASRTGRAVREALAAVAAYRPRWERVSVPAPDRWSEPGLTWRDTAAPAGAGVVASVLDRHDPVAGFGADRSEGDWAARYEQVVAQWPLLLPHHPDLLAAHGHGRLSRGLRKNRSGAGELLDGLARASVRTGAPACSALLLGLALDNGAERTRAVDAWADLAGAGLLDAAEVGRQAAPALAEGVVVGQRLAGSLADAALAGRAASNAVLDALTTLLPALPGRRDAHAFVDLLAALATAHGRRVALPEEFAALAKGRSSSVLAAACRRVPA